jgi:hypothetical protein
MVAEAVVVVVTIMLLLLLLLLMIMMVMATMTMLVVVPLSLTVRDTCIDILPTNGIPINVTNQMTMMVMPVSPLTTTDFVFSTWTPGGHAEEVFNGLSSIHHDWHMIHLEDG